jgi:putative aldouronate transport system permease protein
MQAAMRRFFKRTPFDVVFNLVIVFLCALVFLIVAYPLYFIIIASFSDPTAIYKGQVVLWPKGFNTFGYQKILADTRIWRGYGNTIFYTFAGTALDLLVTVPAAYALSVKTFAGRKPIMTMFVITMFFGGGLIPTYMLIRDLNMIDTPFAMIVPFCVNVFNLIITRTYMQTSIPDELYEAATLDGCPQIIYFTRIVLPLSKSIISVIGLYYFVGHWNSWFNALMFLNKEDMMPLQMVLRSILLANKISTEGGSGMGDGSVGFLMKSADLIKYGVIIVSSLPLILIYLTLQKHFEKGIMIGSLKG